MTVLTNPQHEKFAQLMAEGRSATKAYILAGYSTRGARQSAHALLGNTDVWLRVAELKVEVSKRTVAGIVNRRIADVNARLQEWQERWDEIRDALDSIIIERGEELGQPAEDGTTIAGGSTGFICRDYKGKNADVPIYRVDPGIFQLLRALLDIGKRVAVELGQWEPANRPALEEEEERPDLSRLTIEERLTWLRFYDKATPKKTQ